MIASSFNKSKNLYDYSVDLSKNWISKYYPNNNYKFYGISLEKIQAFSQHHFFSSLLQKQPIDDVWGQYPQTFAYSLSPGRKALKYASKLTHLLKLIVAPRAKIKWPHVASEVLIVASGRHLSGLLPLIKYLSKRRKVLVVGKITEVDQKYLKSINISFLNLTNTQRYQSRRERLKALSFFVFRRWRVENENALLAGRPWTLRLWYLRLFLFPEIVSFLNFAFYLYLRAKPQVILTSTSNDTFGSAFALMAKSFGIKVAEIQHGIATWEIIESDFYFSDYYLVWGRLAKMIHPKNAYIAGCPYYKRPKHINHVNLKEKKIINVLVLWAPIFGTLSLFLRYSNKQSIEKLVKGLSKLDSGFRIILRNHPSYSLRDDLDDLELPANVKVDNSSKVENVINKSDVVITGATTAGLIAILKNKPTLYFDNSFLSGKFGDPFVKSKSSINIKFDQLEDIDVGIKKILYDKNKLKRQRFYQNKFSNHYVSAFGIKSFMEIDKFINKVIVSEKPQLSS
ncbi:MAG: hypothetical protein NUV69_04095 [Candidatus Curtissbacteria bacterium]|nr:hypothetical protein [Candidatus Curtissbacteria bacterium]